jgi:predicted nucleotidyltransferase
MVEASHSVSDERLGEPRTNRELFDLLAAAAWIGRDLAEGLRTHGYTARVDSAAVQDRLRTYFADHGEGLAAVYLFGSVARGTARVQSDVDVGVLFQDEPESVLTSSTMRLEGELERVLGRRCQVVAMNTAPVDLAIRVLRAGVLLLDRDRSARIRFEVRTRNEYFDLEPHLMRYRKMEPKP